MPVWQVAVILNLVLAVGVGMGYGAWGRRAAALDRELETARARVERLEREREACAAGARAGEQQWEGRGIVRAGEQQWEGRGIVRAAYPGLLVITHEEIRGLLSARTTGFRATSPATLGPTRVGSPVRFWLRGTDADDAVLVGVVPW